MSRQEKHAWFNIGVFILAVTLFLTVLLVFPHIGILPATGCFGILGLWGLGNSFYRKSKTGVPLDEREQIIQRRAMEIGYGVFWSLFVVFTMLAWYFHRGGMVIIPADNLPLFVFGGMAVLIMTQSITMLILSKRSILHG